MRVRWVTCMRDFARIALMAEMWSAVRRVTDYLFGVKDQQSEIKNKRNISDISSCAMFWGVRALAQRLLNFYPSKCQ